jgi:hypothetical protein
VKRFVGIDVAKLALDVFIGSAGGAFSVANDGLGVARPVKRRRPLSRQSYYSCFEG